MLLYVNYYFKGPFIKDVGYGKRKGSKICQKLLADSTKHLLTWGDGGGDVKNLEKSLTNAL